MTRDSRSSRKKKKGVDELERNKSERRQEETVMSGEAEKGKQGRRYDHRQEKEGRRKGREGH